MTSTLGKRKERDEEVKRGSTLFVSNLPYTATSVDLQTLFSDIAPVRSAFVVTEHGTGISKGVGYVSFSIKEDAQSAYEKLSQEGISLAGRQLRIQWADNKPREKGEKVKEPKSATAPRPQHPKAPQNPLAIRTVVVSGLPSSVDSKVLWKKFRKYPGAEKVEWPVKSEEEEQKDTAHVLFDTAANAQNASNKLHAHVFKGSLLSAALKKRLDNLQKPGASTSAKSKIQKGKATPNTPSHASRLIVRNIPFNTTEQDLRAIFLPYGPLYSIHIPLEKAKDDDSEVKEEEMDVDEGTSSPRSPKKAVKPRTRGFAFVWMMSKKDAEKAIEGCNGTVIRGGLAESMVEDKQKRKKQKRLEKKLKAKQQSGGDGEEGEGDEDQEEVEEPNEDERIIAVDWALSKSKWEEEKAKIEAAQGEDDEEEEEESEGSSDSDSESSDSEEDVDEALGLHEHEDNTSQEDSDDEDDDDAHSDVPVKPQLPTPDSGTTLFIRNIPFTATEDELRTLFRAFGPLRYARITMDPETGRSRGTGFACFWNKEDADKVIEQSDLLRQETTGSTDTSKKNPFSMPSILTPDPSSTLARTLVLQGRTLDVVRAVTRDEAGKLKEEGEKRRQKADKRNMYLLREGVILPNTPAASTLSPSELERRTASFGARKNLLKSNPSLYISKTRLSIRQIPTFVTEHMLKRLALYAVKAFNVEFKNGQRAGLTADELDDGIEEDKESAEKASDKDESGSEDESAAAKKGKGKKSKRLTGVKQAKIVRQQERVDPVTGKGRSKGYGFVEMYRHADALRVLRWANNNPKVGELFEEWWRDELKVLLKAEKQKPQKDDARIKRIQEEIDDGGAKKSKGTLIVEFSIENVQVVQRRNAKQGDRILSQSKPKAEAKQEKLTLPKAKPEDSPSPKKKPRVSRVKSEEDEKKPPKQGQSVGFLIGRKRKERKVGKGNRK
ncbi:RNA recognition motif-containing protein [Stygiomarasmius scandens]|uniref:RNA recognition motif-containing protein n=1 Tax=Marasmiellus scandens TaxID=2682957 RepID=A0ABR1JJX7_9AGAR